MGLTARQWQIAALMADDLVDAVIASRLEVSIRTVRSEIAAILRALDASSRFGAGIALGRALQQFEGFAGASPPMQGGAADLSPDPDEPFGLVDASGH